jgi:hypothetical protein
VPTDDRQDCARLERLLTRMDEIADASDPSDALTPDELEWAATHLDRCARCARADDAAAAPLLAALRAGSDLDLPADDVFAESRAAVLGTILAGSTAGAVRESGRRSPRSGALRPPAAAPARRTARSWRAVAGALAAGLVLLVAGALLRAPDERLAAKFARPAAQDAAIPTDEDLGAIVADDDAWVVASNDLLGLDNPPAGDRSLPALSDEELDEVEGVFVSMPGWS